MLSGSALPSSILADVVNNDLAACLTITNRAEVAQLEKTVVDAVHSLIPNATALSCGSCRRGKLSSGDCDVLITDPDNEECDVLPGTAPSLVLSVRVASQA